MAESEEPQQPKMVAGFRSTLHLSLWYFSLLPSDAAGFSSLPGKPGRVRVPHWLCHGLA